MAGWISRVIDFCDAHKFAVFLSVVVGCILGCWSIATMRMDALPDLGETQVIIYSRWDRAPDVLESQVTYPIVTAMLGAPRVKSVRGFSDFGYSYVYVIFEDNTDIYWARSRILESLSGTLARLPDGVKTEIGPDASSLGWVFQYALVDPTGQHNLADLRSYQDWYLRNYLKAVPGVSDVAPIGGFTRQYQVNLDPAHLQGFGISTSQVVDALRAGNAETSGRLLEFGGSEYVVRGRGYATTLDDFRNIVVAAPADGSVIRVRDLGEVVYGPDLRRGIADLDGAGDVVAGTVIVRGNQNVLEVTNNVKTKLRELEASLPAGMKVVPIYDRSQLIHRTIDTTEETILEVIVTIALVIIVFLWHFPSAIIPLVTMPAAILLSFIPLRLLGISINVMSLAGVAIALGELIDASIVVVEQTHKRLEHWERAGRLGNHRDVVLAAVKEVAGPTFFALMVIAVSFLPVLTLQSEEGKMFRPLAYGKSMAMIAAALLAITLDPTLRLMLTKATQFDFRPRWLCRLTNVLLVGRVQPEDRNPISQLLIRIYEPVVTWTLRNKAIVLVTAFTLMAVTFPVFRMLGSEFMPPMDEGDILFMPTTMPGISVTEAQRVLQATDSILKDFPEVDRVLGKAGRSETPTDSAPLSMFETLITLKPRSEWRRVHTWYSSWAPEWIKPALRHVTSDAISSEQLVNQMNAAVKAPGVANAWTMPIKGRLDMLTTGIRTPVGLKISGSDLQTIEDLGKQVEAILPSVRGTRSVFAERTNAGRFVDVTWRREELARYGISVEHAQEVLNTAVGGENISTVFLGAERYPVNVRYMRDFRSDLDALGRVLISAGNRQAPISELATIQIRNGPAMIRDENGSLTGYVYVDVANRDPGSYIAEASHLLQQKLRTPTTYVISWSGQHEAMERSNHRLRLVLPATLALIALLIYASTRSLAKTAIVLLAVPFSAVGAIWLLFLLHYNMSVAVWVGIIGLLSIDAETGVFMLLYLDLACEDARRQGCLQTLEDLRRAIVYGAAKRLRPKFMTFATTCIGLFPIMWSVGAGSDVMKRIATPMIGGIFTSFALELLVYPTLYEFWKRYNHSGSFSSKAEVTHSQSGVKTC